MPTALCRQALSQSCMTIRTGGRALRPVRAHPFLIGLDITHCHEIPPVAVQAVLLVDEQQLAPHVWPVLLQQVDNGVLIPESLVVLVAWVCELSGQDL